MSRAHFTLRDSLHSWHKIESAHSAYIHDIALDISQRLCDEVILTKAIENARQQSLFPQATGWRETSLSNGPASIALLCAYLDQVRPNDGWDSIAHSYLAQALQAAQKVGLQHPGLFSGLAGLAFTAQAMSHSGTRYQKAIQTLEITLINQAKAVCADAKTHSHGLSYGHYDVVSGLAGIGAYLLCCDANDTIAMEMLDEILHWFVDLAKPKKAIPSWFIAQRYAAQDFPEASKLGDLFNLGMAHGAPCIMAFLALAKNNHQNIDGIEPAIRFIADWLLEQRCDDSWGINWPTHVPADSHNAGPPQPARAAWCYGAPGVARALWLAGMAVDDQTYRAIAIKAMEAVYRRPAPVRNIDSPIVCHGIAGLLQTTLRFAIDTGLSLFEKQSNLLIEQLLALYDPDSLLGFSDFKYDRFLDEPGLLYGAAGVALTLLAASSEQEPTWDRVFLLA